MSGSSSHTYRAAPGETTELQDIMRKKGVIPPSEYELQREAAAAVAAAAEAAEVRIDPLAFKSVAELDALEEDDAEFGDSHVLDAYRARRVAELKAVAARARFGEVLPLARVDFVAEVNDASRDGTWVVLHLHQDRVTESVLLGRALSALAARFRAVKFMSAIADACIEAYPDRNVPTLLLYRHGVLSGQLVGAELTGAGSVRGLLEWLLSKRGVIETDLVDDPREGGGGGRSGGGGNALARGRRDGDSDEEVEVEHGGGKSRGRRGW